jgi:RNA polymerase sigma-70 factor (sigma-E family)
LIVSDDTFSEFVRVHRRQFLARACALTGNPDDAEDLLQVALLRLHRYWGSVRGRDEPAVVAAYLHRTLITVRRSQLRRRVAEFPAARVPDRTGPDHAEAVAVRQAVREALGRLPNRQRAVLRLRYLEDQTCPQVAARLGVSTGTIKSTCSRALARLRADGHLNG